MYACQYLDDDDEADASTDVSGVSIHAAHDIDDSLANSDDETEDYDVIRMELSRRIASYAWRLHRTTHAPQGDPGQPAHVRLGRGATYKHTYIQTDRFTHLDNLGSGKQLHDHSRRNNGRDTELHKGSWMMMMMMMMTMIILMMKRREQGQHTHLGWRQG
jgi:hypothetical protein